MKDLRIVSGMVMMIMFAILMSSTLAAVKRVCNRNNNACDFYVGHYKGYIYTQSYSSVNGEPIAFAKANILCAAEPFKIPFECFIYYRRDDGNLESSCFWSQTNYSSPFQQVNDIPSLTGGIRFDNPTLSVGGCVPFDMPDNDTIVSDIWDGYSSIGACGTSPKMLVSCRKAASQQLYYIIQRVQSASFPDSPITKNNNWGKVCKKGNGNCDWVIGNWAGYVVSQSYNSVKSSVPIAIDLDNIRCTPTPFLIPMTCTFGYREDNGALRSTCFWHATQYTSAFNQINDTPSFSGGNRFNNAAVGVSGCVPFDRPWIDFYYNNIWDGVSPIGSCPSAPNVAVACEAGVSQRLTQYMVRVRPASFVGSS